MADCELFSLTRRGEKKSSFLKIQGEVKEGGERCNLA